MFGFLLLSFFFPVFSFETFVVAFVSAVPATEIAPMVITKSNSDSEVRIFGHQMSLFVVFK